MGWGGGWGDHVPETARIVAKAFWAGKPCKRGNCETDGETYFLEGTAIAKRKDLPMRAAYKLIHDGEEMSGSPPLEPIFSFAGWPTKMTARHLCALGVRATCYGLKKPSVRFNDIEVNSDAWFTKAEIEALEPPPVVPKPLKPPRETRCNKTLELFA